MFDFAIGSLMAAIMEEKSWQKRLSSMTPMEQHIALKIRKEQRKEMTEERRHRELIAAIKSTSFWP